MTKRPEIVFNGYIELTLAEKAELVAAINEYVDSSGEKRASINESTASHVMKMDLGPMGGGDCPCCGR